MKTFKQLTSFTMPSGIMGASLSTDEQSLVAACMDGVYLADIDQQSSQRLIQHSSYVSSAAFLPSQQLIVSAGYDGILNWLDSSSHELIRQTRLHEFWSWDMAVSPDETMIASVTGQYLAGSYKYDPLPEREPSVRIVDAATGEILHNLPHVPSVQSVAFTPDSQFVAAGNLMGEIRIWNVHTGELAANFTTEAFTSWGIIKSHCYLGGIFDMTFTPDGRDLLLTGMGPMRDPMAGNGRQLWQKWTWTEKPARLVDETHPGESSEGLMEALAIHPDGRQFFMGGRFRGGESNAAMFDLDTGDRITQLKTNMRITEAMFTSDGARLILTGMNRQPGLQEDGVWPDFGSVEIYGLG